jgi:putative membrane protein
LNDPAARFEVATNAQTHFAWLRTRLSVERTLMSCVRTATALVGFTIFQFFEHLEAAQPGAMRPQTPRYLGLALIAAGVLLCAVVIRYDRVLVRYLWSQDFAAIAGVSRELRRQGPALRCAGEPHRRRP